MILIYDNFTKRKRVLLIMPYPAARPPARAPGGRVQCETGQGVAAETPEPVVGVNWNNDECVVICHCYY